MRSVRTGVAVAAIIIGATAANADSMTLRTLADPADRAGALKLFGGVSGFLEEVLDDDVPIGGVSAQIDLPPAAAEASLIVVWSNGRQTSFPILLSSSFANQTVEVHLLERAPANRPTSLEVRRTCEQTAPAGISPVFEMLFTCKGFALALEDAGEEWDPDHRRALNGWLVANYRLLTLGSQVSPYGLDPDLRARLKEALDREEHERRGDRGWAPLRLIDAKTLIELTETRPVRMAGYVPDLVQTGAISEARAVNTLALETIRQLQPDVAIDGITERLLLDNQTYLENLAIR